MWFIVVLNNITSYALMFTTAPFFDLCGPHRFCIIPTELTPKLVAKAFWIGEVENELRRLELTTEFAFKTDADIDQCMERIDKMRQTSIYHHPSDDCTTECKERGTSLIKLHIVFQIT